MNDINLIELLTPDQIANALDECKTSDMSQALTKGLQLIRKKEKFDDSVILGLESAIEKGSSNVVNIASLIAKSYVEKYDAGQILILKLAKSKRVQGRTGAVLCLSAMLSDDFLREILISLSTDKSKRVREMVVDWIGRNRKIQFLPLLVTALENEDDLIMRSYISKEIALLNDGYFVSRENGNVYVTVALPTGIIGGFFNELNREELSDKEIAEIFLRNKEGRKA